MSLFELFYRQVYTKVFPDYFVELKKVIGSNRSILDLGCGSNSVLKLFPKDIYSVGVEAYEPYLEKSKKQEIHKEYHKMDVLEIESKFGQGSFDCVYAGDLIEHLEKEAGMKLIQMMEKIAKKKVIIFTPNGFMPMAQRDGNILYIHKSGWNVEEMKDLGFEIIGMGGWKFLRGDDAGIRFWPRFLWRIISDLTQFYTKSHPKQAKQILCIKTIFH